MRPGVFKKYISTQQSTWMALEDGSSTAVALEDGGGAAVLGGGVGRRFKIAAAVLGGGSSRRTCNDGIGISVVEADGLLSRRQRQYWQGQRQRTRPMRGTYIDGNGSKEIGVSRWRWRRCRCKDGVGKARAR